VEQTGNLIFDRVAAINQQVIIDTPFRRLNGSAFLASQSAFGYPVGNMTKLVLRQNMSDHVIRQSTK